MKLSEAQRIVLANSLSWCRAGYEPSEEHIQGLFAWTDRGEGQPDRSNPLFMGWVAYYQDPFQKAFEKRWGSLDLLPPAGWIEAFFFHPLDWDGSQGIVTDFIHDCVRDAKALGLRVRDEWLRVRPAYVQTRQILERMFSSV